MKAQISFPDVVRQVANHEQAGYEQLYTVLRMQSASLRSLFGFQDYEDRLHDVFLLVAQKIQAGELNQAQALYAFIQGVARLMKSGEKSRVARRLRIAGFLESWERRRKVETPEQQLNKKERGALMRSVMAEMKPKDREIIQRFYLDEQPKTEICREMHLTETQYRLLKSRAKKKLASTGVKLAA